MIKNLLFLTSIITITGCSHPKTCEQSYIDTVSIENKTDVDINISVLISTIIDEKTQTVNIQLMAGEKNSKYQLNTGSYTREGQQRKIGPRYDATCTPEPETLGASIYLNSASFAQVKHCYIRDEHKSLIIKLTDRALQQNRGN